MPKVTPELLGEMAKKATLVSDSTPDQSLWKANFHAGRASAFREVAEMLEAEPEPETPPTHAIHGPQEWHSTCDACMAEITRAIEERK